MNTLIATVGSNPLPVIVSIRTLKPNRLWLLYTDDVQEVTNRISNHLKGKLPNCNISPLEIKDHQKAKSIHAILGEITEDWPNTSLNYTGGTKLMAVHVHSFWKEKGGRSENASYLGSDGRLYFDDGMIREEKDLPSLSLDEQCLLHIGKIPHARGNHHCELEYVELAEKIYQAGCRISWGKYKQMVDKANKDKNFADVYGEIKLGLENIPDFCNSKFLQGDWLEIWLAHQLKQIEIDGTPLFDNIEQHVKVDQDPDFEMDMVATRGYRVFVFSCAAQSRDRDVKEKFFEVVNRAARIGGEHARAAVVCLHENPQTVLRTVQAEHWPGYDTLRLFGQAHIKGEKAPCQVGEQVRPVTLLAGIREWVLQA
ncbi:MAG: hypothetical protein IPK63_16665 [Candidatus Competibacteraceae bacterium]|nr:hypothetical protein [Candidatus Competibacteraceae bacterium]